MGWNLCLATEKDRVSACHLESLGPDASDRDYELASRSTVSLSRPFSYGLCRDGALREWLTAEELDFLWLDDIDEPSSWQQKEPAAFLAILRKVRARLHEESSNMPVDHFLFFVDEVGKRWGGATRITLPFGGIEWKFPHEPMLKLDGGHHDPSHRNELRVYDVRIDPELLEQSQRELEEQLKAQSSDSQSGRLIYGNYGSRTNPIVEEPTGWLPVQPMLDVLGCQVEVRSTDALSLFSSDINRAVAYCEQCIEEKNPLYLLMT